MTYQARETLLYRGEKRKVRCLPLEPFLEQLREKDRFAVAYSGCWRGYVGRWEARDDEFHLIGLDTLNPGAGLAELFPGRGDAVKASWFSGPITPDDVDDPDEEEDGFVIRSSDDRPTQPLWFALLVHRGDVLLEEAVDLRDGAVESRLTRHVERLFPADELPFLRAIQADVSSPGPKLVYADWLEDRGDPRARLLRAGAERDAPRGWPPPTDRISPPGSSPRRTSSGTGGSWRTSRR